MCMPCEIFGSSAGLPRQEISTCSTSWCAIEAGTVIGGGLKFLVVLQPLSMAKARRRVTYFMKVMDPFKLMLLAMSAKEA